MFTQNINIFKIVTIAASVIIGVVAILIFSGKFPGISSSSKQTTNKPTLNVWGTVPQEAVDKAMLATSQATAKPFQFSYTYVDKNQIAGRLTQADATGQAPDLVLVDSDVINTIAGLLYVIPYTYMGELDYKNMYIDASHSYAYPMGAQGYPVLVDPMITYYNKKMFRENNIANPPANWLELPKYQEKLTIRQEGSIPEISAFGMGANNVTNQADLLIVSLMQLGHNPARAYYSMDSGNKLSQNFNVDLGLSSNQDNEDLQSDIIRILRFQTAFSNPQKTVYTWSEKDDTDIQKFLSGRSAMYFGRASDYYKILSSSPNLELGISFLPQLGNKYNLTTGSMTMVAVSKSTKDFPYAVDMAQQIAGVNFSKILSQSMGVSSARKDILAGNDGSARSTVIGSGALTMQIFYNINFQIVNGLIYNLYNSILAGKSVEKSVEAFDLDFNKLYKPSI